MVVKGILEVVKNEKKVERFIETVYVVMDQDWSYRFDVVKIELEIDCCSGVTE